jgi:ABC-type dipeptide/oligopeptide/nickel transport system ATPase component
MKRANSALARPRAAPLLPMPWHEPARAALKAHRILVLVGEAGCGKTAFVQHESRTRAGASAEELQGGPKVDDVAFWGRYVLEGDTTPFRNGPLARALLRGAFFVLNDAGQVPFAQLSALLPFRHAATAVNPISQDELAVPDGFRIVLTTNRENATCRHNLTAMQALLDGALVVDVPEPDSSQLAAILEAHVPEATAREVKRVLELRGQFVELCRTDQAKERKVQVGVRACLQLLRLLRAGVGQAAAVEMTLVGKFLLDEDRYESARLTLGML